MFWFVVACCLASAYGDSVPAKTFVVSLDDPPETRWNHVVTHFKPFMPSVVDYFDKFVKSPLERELIEKVAASIIPLMGDLGKEIRGMANLLELDPGLMVALNFAYELRSLSSVGHPNTTGGLLPPHGACTSIVAETVDGTLWHGRNLDWNLPNGMRNLTFIAQWTKGGKVLFQSVQYAGYVGVLTGVRNNAFGVSINERSLGGSPLLDALEAILRGGREVSHLNRLVLETATTFKEAVEILSTTHIAAPVYYIVSGLSDNEGVVLTRDRNSLRDARPLAIPNDWYVLETNYDWWEQPQPDDNRRAWGLYYMNKMGRNSLNQASLYGVMDSWPLKNDYTTYTAMMSAKTSSLSCIIHLTQE